MDADRGWNRRAGIHGWVDLHLYALAVAAVLTGCLLWWTNASWRERVVAYPPMRGTLRQCRGDIVKAYLVVERHLAGEHAIRLDEVDGYLGQATDGVDRLAGSLRAAVASYGPDADEEAAFGPKLADFRRRIVGFGALLRQSLLDAGRYGHGVERHAAFAALENDADTLDGILQQRVLAVSTRQDRANKLLFSAWLAFAVVLAVTLTLAGRRRNKAEARLLQSEARYRSLFEQAMDVIWLVDEDTERILDCNPAVATEWGYDREALLGEDPARYRPPSTAVREAGEPRAVLGEMRIITRVGEIRDVSVRTGFFTLGSRRVRLEIYRDVTERKRDETALAEREAMLRHLGDNLPKGMIYKIEVQPDDTRRFLYVSGGVERLFGVTAAQALADARAVFSRILPQDEEILHKAKDVALSGLVTIDVRVRFTGKDGAIHWGQFRAAPRRSQEGVVVFDGILLDVTAQKQSEERLRRAMVEARAANIAKSEFLANISHEVRTPLNGVLGMLQLLETSGLSEEYAGHVATALSCGRGLVRILSDILDFSLLDAGRLALRSEVCDLRALVADVLEVFSVESARKGLRLAAALAPKTPQVVLTDPARLRQILFNVVGNAVKFTETGSVRLEVALASQRGREAHLLFTVTDSGIGIPEDKLDAIFEPFTQIDGSLTRKYGGTGLGLGIVKRLIGLLGGVIAVDSLPGRGTEFAFSVRCRLADTAVEAAVPVRERTSCREGVVRVLVVEDEAINRLATVSMLRKLGFAAEAVEDGDEALNVLARQHFDVVLMDIQMPRLSGDEATRRIRRGERAGIDPDIPVIALTAHAMAGDRERCLACGMDDYLSKPVDIAALGQAVSRAACAPRGANRPIPIA